MTWFYLLFALAAGIALPVQTGINAELAHWVGSPVRAALVSFAVGTAALFLVSLLVFNPLPSAARLADAPWWVWFGGLLGAFYIVATVVTAPTLGAAALVALVVAGQSVASLVIDHFGWVGFEEQHVSPGRLVGMALVVTGAAFVRFF